MGFHKPWYKVGYFSGVDMCPGRGSRLTSHNIILASSFAGRGLALLTVLVLMALRRRPGRWQKDMANSAV